MAKSFDEILQEAKEYLAIDQHSLDVELSNQPRMFYDISAKCVTQSARKDFLKEELATLDAALYKKHKTILEKSGVRATEQAVANAIIMDAKHKKLSRQLAIAKEKADKLTALKDAFHQRGYMLRDMCGLYVANYFEKDSVEATGNIKEVKAAKTRERLNEARQETVSNNSMRRRRKKLET